MSFNSKLFVNKDASLNSKLNVGGDASFNSKFYVFNDVSFNSKLFVNGDASLNSKLNVGGDASFNSKFYVFDDVSFNSKLFVNGDASLNSKLNVGGDASFNSKFYVFNDVSFNSKLFVNGDVSMNGNLSINMDLSLNGNLYVTKRALFTLDVSAIGNMEIGLGTNSVSINKDISSSFALDVSGETKIRGNMDVSGVFTVNGAPVTAGAGGSLTGNVQIGTDSGFVSIDKPQFYADPSLTIFYDFDSASYTGTTITNKAPSGGFTATLQGTTTGMIDTSTFKNGTASLRNDLINSNNQGIKVNSTVPIGTFMTFSFWLRKKSTPPSTTFDRIFEFSEYTSPQGGVETNTIALDISTSGIILPALTSGSGSCFGTLTTPNISYNVCDDTWKHIVWVINGSSSVIYINGFNTQQDAISPTPFSVSPTRTNVLIGNSNYNIASRDFSGNIDDFRYYKDKALTYPEIYQLYNNSFYTLDICGGFLANGSSVIYESSGSIATANRGTLTLMHGDASGSSSIMFKSVNDTTDYAYIEYDENLTGSTGTNYGLMTIGIENDATASTTQGDRISLFAAGGQGFVGVNTKTPLYSLDVNGTLNTNADASINGIQVGRGAGNLSSNTAFGRNALIKNTSGAQNTAVGQSALQSNTTGINNTALGQNALTSNISSINNTAVGYQALSANQSGSQNIAVGSYALSTNTSGSMNVAIGYDSGINSTNVGSYNTFLGASTNMNGNHSNSTAVGYNAQITASNQIRLGTNTETVVCQTFNTNADVSINGIQVGRGAGNLSSNTAFGINALITNTNGNDNTAVGQGALQVNISGNNNTAVGKFALNANTSFNNTAVGQGALQVNTTGETNTAVGKSALTSNIGGSRNTAFGSSALAYNTSGNENVAIGVSTLQNTTTQSYNTAIGRFAGSDSDKVGENNTFLGANTAISGNWSNSTAVGYGAIATASNQVQLGNTICTAQATSFNATSDYREKDNVMELNETFTVDTLRPVVYDFKPLGKKHIGFIAHEVQEFYPFLVSGEKDGPHSQSMNYNGFIGILTKEIQVLKKKVAEQEAKALEKALEQDTRIQTLEKLILNK